MANQADITAQADIDLTSFEVGLKKMQGDLAKVEKNSAPFKNVSRNNFAFGGVSMQLQDVAVQLQSGAAAATVIAQQGSQIASLFGPSGALLGGVIAIGAGIFSWATNAKRAQQEVEAMEASVKRQQEDIKQLGELSASARDSINDSIRRRLGGDEYAEDLKRYEKHLKNIENIRQRYGGAQDTGFEREELKRYEEEEKLIKARRDEELDAKYKVYQADIRASVERQEQYKRDIENESDLQKIRRLGREADELEAKKAASGGGLAFAKLEEAALQKRADAAALQRKVTEEGEQNLANARRQADQEFEQSLEDQAKESNKRRETEEKITEEKIKQAQAVEKAAKAESKARKEAQDQYIDNAVKRKRMTPKERRDEKKEAAANAKAIRQIDAKERESERASAANRRAPYQEFRPRNTADSRAAILRRAEPKIQSMVVQTLTVNTIEPKK